MLSNSCQVQIDAASYKHFKYSWSIISKPTIYDLKQILKQKLNNPRLFENHNLFCIGNNSDNNNADDRRLIHNEKFGLKSLDQSLFYAQALANESNADLIAQLKADAEKLQQDNADLIKQLTTETEKLDQEIEAQIKFRRNQSNSTVNFHNEIKEQMRKECEKISDNINLKVTKEAIESSYKLLLTQKCNFDEKKINLFSLYKKYQKLYKRTKLEYDRIKDKHFEGICCKNIICIYTHKLYILFAIRAQRPDYQTIGIIGKDRRW